MSKQLIEPAAPTKQLYVSVPLHVRLRIVAAKLGLTMREVTEKAVERYLLELEEGLDA